MVLDDKTLKFCDFKLLEETETEIMSPLKYRSKSDDFSQARDLA